MPQILILLVLGLTISLPLGAAKGVHVWYDEVYRRIVLEPGEHKLETMGHLPAYFYSRDDFVCEDGESTYFLVLHDVDSQPRLIEHSAWVGEHEVINDFDNPAIVA